MWLKLADILLTLIHLAIIGFNLLGWVWLFTRRLHLIVAGITAGCWFIPGIWFGIGYCPVTDLQWHVKEKLGEVNLPSSFITYFADKIAAHQVSVSLIDTLTTTCFFAAVAISVYLNFFARKRP
jgi:hypothetical protein